ncbi:MAG: amidohydrolase family protein [Acidobacteriota bacterium]|nr:amidohydrolase family protein [Acidobacteriota bacterium]
MPRVHLRLLAASVVLLLVVSSSIIFADAQGSGTDTYAITNARIVTVSGPVIERGTVVIRDGLIAAVGVNATVPADARVIDGNGLTIYPGLIDASTSLGIPEPSPSPSPSPGQGGGFLAALLRPAATSTSSINSTQPVGLQPEVLAESLIKPGGDQIETERSAGVTTALTVPRTGIWIGQSALINLAGDTPQQMIVRSPVAMHVGFTPLRGGYPGSLMGVFATLRQMLLDAQRYREAQRIYEQSPRGLRRPSQDRSLEALLPVIDGRIPVVMYADREREVQRALDLADEFKLKAIIAGGSESWKLADRLQKGNVPVLLSLNFPKRTTAAMPEADPEPLRVLRERVAAPKTAGKLANAKVRFAFQSGGMSTISDFVANAAKTIDNGLSKDDALRAFTIRSAEIFGVADRLGSIETGKIANLTIMRGDLFDRNSRVTHVFIDGRPVDLRPVTAGTGQAGNIASGAWTLTVDLGQGELAVTLTLQQEGDRLRGSMQGALGSVDISNASVGPAGDIRFTAPVTFEGQTTEATFTGTITGNEMRGAVNITGRAPGSFTASRPPAPGPQAPPATTTPPGNNGFSGR